MPALAVLAAEPLYLLLDTAVVGRLGADALAGLALGGVVLAQVSTQLTFLSYGTTARSARMHGAGRTGAAVGEGIQATWLAVILGVVIAGAVQVFARPLLSVLGGGGPIAAEAVSWLRIASLGAPLILIGLAGNGWMRGVQNTVRPLRCVLAGIAVSAALCPVLVHGLLGAPRLGLPGSALANVLGQAVAAALFVAALVGEPRGGVSWRPSWAVMRAQMVLGRDLILRSLAFQVCFLSAAAVAARFGAAALAAHQVVLQLWNFLALALDSLAIAAQTLVGAALGAGRVGEAKVTAVRVTRWSLGCAVAAAAFFAAGWWFLPPVFTPDAAVVAQMGRIWPLFVAMIPVAGVVFALDGVLLGAGDARFLRTATLAAALVGFLPLIWTASAMDWGLRGIWSGLAVFMVLRMAAVLVRVRSGRWAVPGVEMGRASG
ncbi:MATE family efflux transporter [Corynebacteriales bacterium D3-21]|uniref:MATE family efflux transporter n=1 Tax=Speluncibacter jeojiensis TaxID=2710754 RepID=A0A9X4LYG1_9ACTN|nr:MATE family efflux transporter [Rhodococcus sp. D2-41]MDG3013916.1 MATE family efflux transporter [Corynebacteriales bacterium D3-21]